MGYSLIIIINQSSLTSVNKTLSQLVVGVVGGVTKTSLRWKHFQLLTSKWRCHDICCIASEHGSEVTKICVKLV